MNRLTITVLTLFLACCGTTHKRETSSVPYNPAADFPVDLNHGREDFPARLNPETTKTMQEFTCTVGPLPVGFVQGPFICDKVPITVDLRKFPTVKAADPTTATISPKGCLNTNTTVVAPLTSPVCTTPPEQIEQVRVVADGTYYLRTYSGETRPGPTPIQNSEPGGSDDSTQ